MNRNIKILISTLVIFLLFGCGLFTYYSVNERKEVVNKYIEKSVKWEDYIDNEPPDMFRAYNMSTKKYDEYILDEINYNELKTISNDIVKEVEQRSTIKLDRKDFSEKLEYDHNTFLTLRNVVVEPIYIKEKEWYDDLENQNRIYNDITNADLYNIPKEIFVNNEQWLLLTDMVNFESKDNKYNCTATYSKIKRVEEEKIILVEYNIKAVYSGELLIKTGNVKLKYILTSQSRKKEIFQHFSIKLLSIYSFIVLSIVSIIILYEKLLTKKC